MRSLLVLISSLLLSFQLNAAHANDLEKDNICLRLPGKWAGTYTYKNKADCRQASGCTQGMAIYITHDAPDTSEPSILYHGKIVTSERHELESIEILCQHNQISIPKNRCSIVSINCEKGLLCIANYDDSQIFATLFSAI